MKSRTIRLLAQGALIAAIYAVLTIALSFISYGPLQVRVSEALCILPMFTPAAIPGLFIGCAAANLIGGYGMMDLLFGGGATLLAAILCYFLRKHPFWAPLPAVVLNAILVGIMLHITSEIPTPMAITMLWIGIGQFLACYVLGVPLYKILDKRRPIFRLSAN